MSQNDIEAYLKKYLGITKIIWLDYGLHGDLDTNGHVDNFVCFIKPCEVILSWTDDLVKDKENYKRCRLAFEILSNTKDAQDRDMGNQLRNISGQEFIPSHLLIPLASGYL